MGAPELPVRRAHDAGGLMDGALAYGGVRVVHSPLGGVQPPGDLRLPPDLDHAPHCR
jgi:hypothetical protein